GGAAPERDRDDGFRSGSLLPRLGVLAVRELGPAVLLGDDQPEEADLPQRLQHLRRKLALAVQLPRVDAAHVPVDRLADRRDQLGLVARHFGIGKELVLEDLAEKQGLTEGRVRIEGHPRILTQRANLRAKPPHAQPETSWGRATLTA